MGAGPAVSHRWSRCPPSPDGSPHGWVHVDLAALSRTAAAGRPLPRFCLDWTEQRHHLAGLLGAAVTTACLDNHWITHRPPTREIRLTAAGAAALREHLGIDLQPTG